MPDSFAAAAGEHGADIVRIRPADHMVVGMQDAIESVRAVDPAARAVVGGAPVAAAELVQRLLGASR